VARPRHEALLRSAIEHYCGIPVLGAVPRLKCAVFPERHMGLVPPPEHRGVARAITIAQELAEKYLDLDGLWQVACQAPPLPGEAPAVVSEEHREPVTLGVIRDAAFQFYYPENLEALEQAGARLVMLNALSDAALPADLDGLYIGGGFPETNAPGLAQNRAFRESLKTLADQGLPVYAECGGLMYLGEAIVTLQGERFPMVGVFPYDFVMGRKPQGHGYTVLEVSGANPFFSPGAQLKGHEFHYSRIEPEPGPDAAMAFRVVRGSGMGGHREGLLYKNVLATYTHLHALGARDWAPALVRQARSYRWYRLSVSSAGLTEGEEHLEAGDQRPLKIN
jgi:cobyrinic acid a,c-diamide synthase